MRWGWWVAFWLELERYHVLLRHCFACLLYESIVLDSVRWTLRRDETLNQEVQPAPIRAVHVFLLKQL
jgi:hypothetical protein